MQEERAKCASDYDKAFGHLAFLLSAMQLWLFKGYPSACSACFCDLKRNSERAKQPDIFPKKALKKNQQDITIQCW